MLPTFVSISNDFDMTDSVISNFTDDFSEQEEISRVDREEEDPATLQDLQAALRQIFLQIYCQECTPNTGVVSVSTNEIPRRRPRNTQGHSPSKLNPSSKDFIEECPNLPFCHDNTPIGDSNKSHDEVNSMHSCSRKSSSGVNSIHAC
jgi:hypothetical protein